MKKLLLLTVALIFLVQTGFANDGSFYVSGNTLIPLQETEISLQKEILKFYIRDFEWMDVEVDFTFDNPGGEKTLTVGFVTPPAAGDVLEEEMAHPQIRDFTVLVNGKNLEYKIQKMRDTSFSADKLKIDGNDFVYYFPVTFKKGVNRIRHTYRFLGGSSIETQRDFEYQITTGRRWANRQIDDFELQIHFDRGIFTIPASFENDTEAVWQIIGRGTMTRDATYFFAEDTPKIKLVQISDGYLLFKKKNFRPDTDIFLAEYNWAAGWLDKMCKTDARCPEIEEMRPLVSYFRVAPGDYIEESDLAQFSARELKIIRNFAYAIRGYDFKTNMLKDFYSQFFWYQPDPSLKLSDIKLTEKEEVFIGKVLNVESRK